MPRPSRSVRTGALQRAHDYLTREWRTRPTFRDAAAAAGLSPFCFHRRFTRHFGRTPKELVDELRMEEAKRLLLEGVEQAEVGERLGFCSHAHFNRRFRALAGAAPDEWLGQQRSGTSGPRSLPPGSPPRRALP